jgi:hypothetical protein
MLTKRTNGTSNDGTTAIVEALRPNKLTSLCEEEKCQVNAAVPDNENSGQKIRPEPITNIAEIPQLSVPRPTLHRVLIGIAISVAAILILASAVAIAVLLSAGLAAAMIAGAYVAIASAFGWELTLSACVVGIMAILGAGAVIGALDGKKKNHPAESNDIKLPSTPSGSRLSGGSATKENYAYNFWRRGDKGKKTLDVVPPKDEVFQCSK